MEQAVVFSFESDKMDVFHAWDWFCMRLNKQQIQQIKRVISATLQEQVVIYLYGSRLDETKKGGDVDLLIKSKKPLSLIDKAKIIMHLEPLLFIPVDISNYHNNPTTFAKIAYKQAVKL